MLSPKEPFRLSLQETPIKILPQNLLLPSKILPHSSLGILQTSLQHWPTRDYNNITTFERVLKITRETTKEKTRETTNIIYKVKPTLKDSLKDTLKNNPHLLIYCEGWN